VRGDYKSGRVKDPTAKISSNHEKTVRKYVKEFMDKAVRKKDERQKMKTAQGGIVCGTLDSTAATVDDASLSDSASELKRKREEEGRFGSPKRTRTGSEVPQPAPPPPPPPPASTNNEEPRLTPMNEASTTSFSDAADRGPNEGKATLQLDGYGSPMQLATPPTNGFGNQEQALINGSSDPHA
jgi:hypothetical protein